MKANRRPLKRPNMRRAVILFPSGFTLGNLFFGIFAIIAASRLEFTTAGVYVLLGGICDALDGRVARATNSGTQFGEELDSLVDAITFGLAPGMIMYFAVLNRDGWDWIFVFLFSACAVLRLARFNIEQAGTAKEYFQGLPSPAAGITLASYYWFSQSWLYSYGAIGDLPWHRMLRFIMAALAMLMISNVPYPTFPRTGFRSLRAIGASLVVFGSIALLLTRKLEYFFPISLIYVSWGLIRWIFSGLFERRQPTVPYDLSEGEDDEDEMEYDGDVSAVHSSRPARGAEPASRGERSRGRTERGERSERGDRATGDRATGDRATGERAGRPEREPREPREPRAPRPEPEARAERPQRTEAERAARREKREKRDKRDEARTEKRDEQRAKREERPERAPRAAAEAAEATPTPEVLGTVVPVAPAAEPAAGSEEQVVGAIPGGAESEAVAGTAGPTRKRKRRRRRGARDRVEGGANGAAGEGGGAEDDGGDDGPEDESEARSPYSAPVTPPVPEHPAPSAMPPRGDVGEAPAARPYTPPLPAPTPPPASTPSSQEPEE